MCFIKLSDPHSDSSLFSMPMQGNQDSESEWKHRKNQHPKLNSLDTPRTSEAQACSDHHYFAWSSRTFIKVMAVTFKTASDTVEAPKIALSGIHSKIHLLSQSSKKAGTKHKINRFKNSYGSTDFLTSLGHPICASQSIQACQYSAY